MKTIDKKYWKIVAEVSQGKLNVYKEVSIWKHTDGVHLFGNELTAIRAAYERFDLDVTIYSNDGKKLGKLKDDKFKNNNHWVAINKNESPDGGENLFLEIFDRGLNWNLQILGNETTSSFKNNILRPYLSEQLKISSDEIKNRTVQERIYVEHPELAADLIAFEEMLDATVPELADIDIRVEAICTPHTADGEYPILWFPTAESDNPNDFLYLGLTNNDLAQSITWCAQSPRCTTRRIFTGNDSRTILVEDASLDSSPDYKFFTDAIPAYPNFHIPATSKPEFSEEGVKFFIGHNPKLLGKPNSNAVFNGIIERIVFDPNSSCTGCDPLV